MQFPRFASVERTNVVRYDYSPGVALPLLPPALESDTGSNAALSPEVAAKNEGIRTAARDLEYEVIESVGSTAMLRRYEDIDLHIGYECHAHIAFLRRRQPSVLIHEDARGVGYTYSLGGSGFDGFVRDPSRRGLPPSKRITSGYATSPEEIEIAPPREDLAEVVKRFIIEELESDFRRVRSIGEVIDETYEKSMLPYLRSVDII